MKNANKLVLNSQRQQICKINIAGYTWNNLRAFDPQGYSILCRLGEASQGFTYFYKTKTIVLTSTQETFLINNMNSWVPKVAYDCGISEQLAFENSVEFFSEKRIVVQPTGLQGNVYSILQNVQNLAPMTYATQAVSILRTTGMTGLQIIQQAPLTFVGVTYVGALFFSYMGCLAGNNSVGYVFNVTSYVLSRPMRGVEITLNGLILRPISNKIGLPLILNGTQNMLSGQGIAREDYTKIAIAFERLTNSTAFQKLKKIIQILRNKN